MKKALLLTTLLATVMLIWQTVTLGGHPIVPDGLVSADSDDITMPEPAEVTAAVTEPAAIPSASRIPLVVLDPGHGGDEIGAVWNGVVEKDSNLDMAFRVEALLQSQGLDVLLTRRSDARAIPDPSLPSVGGSATRGDLQARLDMANTAGASVWVSLHSNGSSNRLERGVEVWYDPNRAFGWDNLRLAGLLQSSVIEELNAYGYPVLSRGLKDDTCFRYFRDRCFTLFVLGGSSETHRAAQMPGALIESLFVSNESDNAVLRSGAGRDAIARGIAQAIVAFLTPPS